MVAPYLYYLLTYDQTIWQDGPLTMAVRYGGICYLDEIVDIKKEIKESTKQRFASIDFQYPDLEIEKEIINSETGKSGFLLKI